jgi:hypothetical protein
VKRGLGGREENLRCLPPGTQSCPAARPAAVFAFRAFDSFFGHRKPDGNFYTPKHTEHSRVRPRWVVQKTTV